MARRDHQNFNPYAILGLQQSASENDIHRAFREKMREHHPDKNRDNLVFATQYAQKICEAKELLIDPEKRRAVDSRLKIAPLMASTEEGAAKRPSWMIDDLILRLSEQFLKNSLPLVDRSEIKELFEKCAPEKNYHFNQRFYQGLYTLKVERLEKGSNSEDLTEDELSFTNLYDYLAKKQQLLLDSNVKPALPNIKTTDVILDLFVQFLKGKFIGNTLRGVIAYLRDKPANRLANAVADLLSITDLKKSYQQALTAIEMIYQIMQEEYQVYERKFRDLEKKKGDEVRELAQVELDLKNAKAVYEEYEKLKPKDDYIQSLKRLMDTLVNQRDLQKEQILKEKKEEKDNKSFEQIEILQSKIDVVKTQIKSLEEYAEEIERKIERLEITRLQDAVERLREKFSALESEIRLNQAKRFNVMFSGLIENKYFKMLVAKCMQFNWQECAVFEIGEYFLESARSITQFGVDEYAKYPSLHLILMLADRQLERISTAHSSASEVIEVAKIFVDLGGCEGNMLLIRPQALMKAGLCFQLASQKFASKNEKMAAENLALTYYQSALRVASNSTSYHLLAVLPIMIKAISQIQYKHKASLSPRDAIMKFKEFAHKGRPFPWELSRLKIYHGDLSQTLECFIDRALYELSIQPLNVISKDLKSELFRSLFCRELLRSMAMNQAEILENPEARRAFENNHNLPDHLYRYYESKLDSYDDEKSSLVEQEKMLLLRLQLISALLVRNNTSLRATNRWMDSPFIPMPQDSDGWLRPGPLIYPGDSAFPEKVYKGFLGFRINEISGKVLFILDEWKPGDPEHLKLFSHSEFAEIVKNGVNHAIFSLDQSEPYKRYAPIQAVYFRPSVLENTAYARSLFLADYIMKMMTSGREINCRPPYQMRSAERLLDFLPVDIKNELLICAKNKNLAKDSSSTRFWIELGSIPSEEGGKGAVKHFLFQQPEVKIKKHLLDIAENGALEDSLIDSPEDSPESQFASALTKHYFTIAANFPVFLQLIEFYKISGAVLMLQNIRLQRQAKIDKLRALLEDSNYWSDLRNKNKSEILDNLSNESYWQNMVEQRSKKYSDIVNDEQHWDHEVERLFEKSNQARAALEDSQGEAYQLKYNKIRNKNSADLFKLQNQLKAIEEQMNGSARGSFKFIVKNRFQSIKSILGNALYNRALSELKNGDVSLLAKAKAEFRAKRFFSNANNKESEQQLVVDNEPGFDAQSISNELALIVSCSKIKLTLVSDLVFHLSKVNYAEDDPEFKAMYEQLRKVKFDLLVNEFKRTIDAENWDFFQDEYHNQINKLLDENLPKQGLLAKINEHVNLVINQAKSECADGQPISVLAIEIWNHYIKRQCELLERELQSARQSEQAEAEFDYLREAFADIELNSIIDDFLQGNHQPLLNALTEHYFFEVNKPSDEKRAEIRQMIEQQREKLRSEIAQMAKSEVDAIQKALINNMEAYLDGQIDAEMNSVRKQIKKLQHLLKGLESLELGCVADKNAPANTHYRIPAVIHKESQRVVYGGVSALPSFCNVTQRRSELFRKLEQAEHKLSLSYHFYNIAFTSTSIESAKQELREISLRAPSFDVALQMKIRNIEERINRAERELQCSPFSTSWRDPFLHSYLDHLMASSVSFDSGASGSTALLGGSPTPPSAPSGNNLSALQLIRSLDNKEEQLRSCQEEKSLLAFVSHHHGSRLVSSDILQAKNDAKQFCSNFASLSTERKAVLTDMALTLGNGRLSQFQRLRKAIEGENWDLAAQEIKKSAWYHQVGQRGKNNVNVMRCSQFSRVVTAEINRGESVLESLSRNCIIRLASVFRNTFINHAGPSASAGDRVPDGECLRSDSSKCEPETPTVIRFGDNPATARSSHQNDNAPRNRKRSLDAIKPQHQESVLVPALYPLGSIPEQFFHERNQTLHEGVGDSRREVRKSQLGGSASIGSLSQVKRLGGNRRLDSSTGRFIARSDSPATTPYRDSALNDPTQTEEVLVDASYNVPCLGRFDIEFTRSTGANTLFNYRLKAGMQDPIVSLGNFEFKPVINAGIDASSAAQFGASLGVDLISARSNSSPSEEFCIGEDAHKVSRDVQLTVGLGWGFQVGTEKNKTNNRHRRNHKLKKGVAISYQVDETLGIERDVKRCKIHLEAVPLAPSTESMQTQMVTPGLN